MLHNKITEVLKEEIKDTKSDDLSDITNSFVHKVESNLESFRYNKIVANFHELYTALSKKILYDYSIDVLKENYCKILITMMPVIPHFSNECLKHLKISDKINWPESNHKKLSKKNINYIFQVNGKTRKILESKSNLSQEELLNQLKTDEKMNKYLGNDQFIKKIIFIPNKLINIII